jgi:hypothetical protein
MSLTELEPDRPYVGLLSETAHESETGAVLVLTRELGVSVTVPYRAELPTTSKTVYATGPSRTPLAPRDLRTAVLHLREGSIWLFGTSKQRETTQFGGTGVSERTFTAEDVVVGFRETDVPSLTVGAMASEMDGLAGWTRFPLFLMKPELGEEGRVDALTYSSPPSQSMEWEHDGTSFKLSNSWAATTSIHRGEATMKARVELQTSFGEPALLSDHIHEQRKLANLLTLVYGSSSRFRRHLVSEAGFSSTRRWALSRHTYEDFLHPMPDEKTFAAPMATAEDLGLEGLGRWWSLPEAWARAFAPTLSALRRDNPVVEDTLVNACISLEGLGRLIGKVEGEKRTYNGRNGGSPTSSTQIYRCLKSVGFEWKGVAPSLVGLAQAIGATYNGVKHLGDKRYPDNLHMYASGRISTLTVRSVAVGASMGQFRCADRGDHTERELVDADRALSTLAFMVDEDGRFVSK